MRKCILIILVLILLLSGCKETSLSGHSVQYDYHSLEITYSEPFEQYAFRINMDCTETAYARYFFEPSIDNAERVHCIEATDRILSKLNELEIVPEIIIFSDSRYSDIYIDGNKLYLPMQDWQSVEYAANVLLTAYGAFTHYGLAYGYAGYICETNIDNVFLVPNTVDACDLNLLCFDHAFVSEDDIAAVKSLALNFVQNYIAAYGESALQKLLSESNTVSGSVAVRDALAKFYNDNSFDYVPSVLRYGYGGHSFDYFVSANLSTFYIKNDWVDMNAQYNPLVYDGFLHQNYADTKVFFQTNLDQMEQYQQLFALDTYNNDLRVIFDNATLPATSFYRLNTHTIFLKNIDSLMHEYIHALTRPGATMKLWEAEGFARYFSYRYDYYGIAFLNQDYNNPAESSKLDYVREYLNVIQRPIDMAVDYGEIENIAVWCFDQRDPNKSYLSGSSFVQYLVDQYGVNAVVNSIYGDKTPLPKSYRDLVRDWIEHIENCCQGYSKYDD